jgi:cobalt transporter subunit CbtA
MFIRVFYAAIVAGLVGGIVFATLQYFRTTPLIIAAEAFEGKSAHDLATPTPPGHGKAGHNHATDHDEKAQDTAHPQPAGEWAPDDGLERTFYSVISNIAVAIGFAFILAALSLLSRFPLTPQNGALWGLVAFAVFSLAPTAGLPPELPGMQAPDLVERQFWWWGCVVAGVVGVGLIALKGGPVFVGLGLAFLAAPHLIGAPLAVDHATGVPAHMIQSFVANSMFVMAVTWTVIGATLGLTFKSQNLTESA